MPYLESSCKLCIENCLELCWIYRLIPGQLAFLYFIGMHLLHMVLGSIRTFSKEHMTDFGVFYVPCSTPSSCLLPCSFKWFHFCFHVQLSEGTSYRTREKKCKKWNIKKPNSPVNERADEMSRLFSKDEVQMANKHMGSAVFLKYLAVPSGTVAKISYSEYCLDWTFVF